MGSESWIQPRPKVLHPGSTLTPSDQDWLGGVECLKGLADLVPFECRAILLVLGAVEVSPQRHSAFLRPVRYIPSPLSSLVLDQGRA